MKTVKFNKWIGIAKFEKYFNGRPAITLVDIDTGERILTCTVNAPDEPQEDGEVFIKNFSENEGMTDSLVYEGIIEPPHRKFQQGFVVYEVCKLK